MHRTPIYLDDRHYEILHTRAKREDKSLAAVIREILDQHLAGGADRKAPDPMQEVIGLGEGSGEAVAENYDEYLYGEMRNSRPFQAYTRVMRHLARIASRLLAVAVALSLFTGATLAAAPKAKPPCCREGACPMQAPLPPCCTIERAPAPHAIVVDPTASTPQMAIAAAVALPIAPRPTSLRREPRSSHGLAARAAPLPLRV